MINARSAQIAQHIRSRFSIALSHQIASQFGGIPQPLFRTIPIQSPMIPFALWRRNNRWPITQKCVCKPNKIDNNYSVGVERDENN